jgi:O-antigen/teichoic acid export membrane protein
VGPSFASFSAPLLPILLAGTVIGLAAQFNSSTILFGLAQHQKYAYGLLAEALGNFGLSLLVIPRYGILGAAWVSAILMIAVRGLYTPWLLCRVLKTDMAEYMGSIFVRPVLTALPVLLLTWWCKQSLLPGSTLIQLAVVAFGVAALYWTLAFFSCLEPGHRVVLRDWVAAKVARIRMAASKLRP